MVVFPNAKINIGLFVTGKRSDGYHELQSVFYPIDLHDALEIITQDETSIGEAVSFHSTGLPIEGPESSNLCLKAYQLLQKEFSWIPAIKMHLHKTIPMGAGMGGGSSNGAFCIRLLNKKFDLGLNEEQMKSLALYLGSDCPFFISNKPSFVTGRGEHIEPIKLDLSDYDMLVVNPGIHVPTGWAFRHLTLSNRDIQLYQDIHRPVSEWKECIVNDFEEPVMRSYPAIRSIKNSLYGSGAIYASMSGSGSTVFGLFQKGQRPEIKFPDGYFRKWI